MSIYSEVSKRPELLATIERELRRRGLRVVGACKYCGESVDGDVAAFLGHRLKCSPKAKKEKR